jgi:hypothetical protein
VSTRVIVQPPSSEVKRTGALRRTASARARDNPDCQDSAAARTRAASSQLCSEGAAIDRRMLSTASDTISSTIVNPRA